MVMVDCDGDGDGDVMFLSLVIAHFCCDSCEMMLTYLVANCLYLCST